eukprot:1829416-Pleurochrysis_carterae.AAC.1
MITYQDFGAEFCGIIAIGNVVSGFGGTETSVGERACWKSVVGAFGMVGIWNDGGSSPFWAAAFACGEVGCAPESAPAAVLVFAMAAKSRLGSVCSPPWSSI